MTEERMMSEPSGEFPRLPKPRKDALESLYGVFRESCRPNWDGYGASAVSYDTYNRAERFLAAFPTSLPALKSQWTLTARFPLSGILRPNGFFPSVSGRMTS